MKKFIIIVVTAIFLMPQFLSASGVSDFIKNVPHKDKENILAAYIKSKSLYGFFDQIGLKKTIIESLDSSVKGNGGKADGRRIKKEFGDFYESGRQVAENFFHEAVFFSYPETGGVENNPGGLKKYLIIARINADWNPGKKNRFAESIRPVQEMLTTIKPGEPSPFMNGLAVRFSDIFVFGDPGTVNSFVENIKNDNNRISEELQMIRSGIKKSDIYSFWTSDNPSGLYSLINVTEHSGTSETDGLLKLKNGFLEIIQKYEDDTGKYTTEDADKIYRGMYLLEEQINLNRGIFLKGIIKGNTKSYTPLLKRMFEDREYLRNAFDVVNKNFGTVLNPDDFEYKTEVEETGEGYIVESEIRVKPETVKRNLSPAINSLVFLFSGAPISRNETVPDKRSSGKNDKKEEETDKTGWINDDTYRVKSGAEAVQGYRNKTIIKERTKQEAIKKAKDIILEDFRMLRVQNIRLYQRSGLSAIQGEFGKIIDNGSVLKEKYEADGSCEIIYQVGDSGLRKQVTGE